MKMKKAIFGFFCFIGSSFGVSDHPLDGLDHSSAVAHVGLPESKEVEEMFSRVYDKMLSEFDVKQYQSMLEDTAVALQNFKNSEAFSGYKSVAGGMQCDRGVVSPQLKQAISTKAMSPFPGGVLKRVFGFDLGKALFELSQKATGPAAASGGMVGILSSQALAMGAGMIQSLVSSAVHIIPPLIPPPVWNNQPLTCMPMITGHNCFGAILHPITMSDFVIADVTDSMVDGYIASFPNTYAAKVGKTGDAAYKLCFGAYMSMMCASIFPRCSVPQTREEPIPAMGRLPMCFTHCLQTLVMCPGFWMEEIMGPCQEVSVPPMCTVAVFWNMWRLPPQYTSFEDSQDSLRECPKPIGSEQGTDASTDYGLYDTESQTTSPLLEAAGSQGDDVSGTGRIPNA